MNDSSAGMGKNDKAEEQSESHGRDYKEIAGRCHVHMVPQEGAPRLERRLPDAVHVLRDGRLCDVEAELEEFAVDSGCTPEQIGEGHFSNEAFDNVRNRRSSLSFPSAIPRPEDLESFPVPADDGIGLYDDKRVFPAVPNPGEENP